MPHERWLSPLAWEMQDRWVTFTNQFNCNDQVRTAAFDILVLFYEEDNRKFHTFEIIRDSLDRLEKLKADGATKIRDPLAIEMALWCSSVIFDPSAHIRTNAARSGRLARQLCLMMNCDRIASHWVGIHIEQLSHLGGLKDPDTDIVRDIDIAPLGLPFDTFNENYQKIRSEHPQVSETGFFASFSSFVTAQMKRPSIYRTTFFQKRYEAQARANIKNFLK